MKIRRATKGDKQRIEDLLSQVLAVHHNARPDIFKSGTRKYTTDELDQIISDDNRPIFVAEEAGEVLGYAFCIFTRHIDNNILTDIKTLYIDDLCVDAALRGQHIGTALYEHVLAEAKREGCVAVTLNVWCLNEGAMRFYEKLGMKPLKVVMEEIL